MTQTFEATTAAFVERLHAAAVLPVVELPSAELARPLAEALLDAGLGCIEITFRTAAAREGIELIRGDFPDLLLGAGTVRTDEQLDAAVESGADFVVSPGSNARLLERCRELGIPALPGAVTATEIDALAARGFRTVKVFPVAVMGGVPLLRALSAPYPEVSFVPTGGIDASNLADYLAVPQVVACGGSWFVKPELLSAHDFDRVGALAAEAVRIAAGAR